MKKQGKKGGEIKYTGIHMASYLQPYSSTLKINEKQEIFSIRNKMVNIPANFGTINECICGTTENSAHIYDCQKLNKERPKIEYEQIYSENIWKIKSVYERFKRNMNEREKQMNWKMDNENLHETNGPLFSKCSMVNTNG